MSKLNLNRAQLASFLKDPQQIKQFEQLFDTVNITEAQLQELLSLAMSAQSTANDALAQITRIADALEFLATAPLPPVLRSETIEPPVSIQLAEPAYQPPVVSLALETISGGPIGALVMNELADVLITTPAAAEVLTYDTGRWRNKPVPAVTGLTVPDGGTGAATFTDDYLIKGNGVAALSSSVIFDNGTNIGVGTTTVTYRFNVNGDSFVSAKARVGDADFYSELAAGNPAINWEANSYDQFNRTSNIRTFTIGSTTVMALSNVADAVEIILGSALKKLELGAADSGGVGYKMVRVTN